MRKVFTFLFGGIKIRHSLPAESNPKQIFQFIYSMVGKYGIPIAKDLFCNFNSWYCREYLKFIIGKKYSNIEHLNIVAKKHAEHRCIDFIRSVETQKNKAEKLPKFKPSVDPNYFCNEELNVLLKVFIYAILEGRDAQIVILNQIEGYKLTEIAEVLNENYNTIKSRFRISMKKLKNAKTEILKLEKSKSNANKIRVSFGKLSKFRNADFYFLVISFIEGQILFQF